METTHRSRVMIESVNSNVNEASRAPPVSKTSRLAVHTYGNQGDAPQNMDAIASRVGSASTPGWDAQGCTHACSHREQCELTRLGHVKLSPGPVLEFDDDVDEMDA